MNKQNEIGNLLESQNDRYYSDDVINRIKISISSSGHQLTAHDKIIEHLLQKQKKFIRSKKTQTSPLEIINYF